MEIKIELNDKAMEDLNSLEVKYYLGDNNAKDAKTVKEFTGILNQIIRDVWNIIDNQNQMNHLLCEGVDNWSEYTHYDPHFEDEEEDDE